MSEIKGHPKFNVPPTLPSLSLLSAFILLSTWMCSLVASFQVIKRTPSCQPVNSWYNQTRLFTCSPIPPARPPLYWDDYAASTLSDKLSTQGGERAFYVSTHSFHKDKDCQAPGSDNRNSTSIQDLTVLTNTTHITRNVHNRNEMVLDRAWHYWTEGLVQTKTDYYRIIICYNTEL